MKFKTCKRCKETKPEEQFRLNDRYTRGYRNPTCRRCENMITNPKHRLDKEFAGKEEWAFLYRVPMR